MRIPPVEDGLPPRLSAFCEREGIAWRVHVHPARLPDYLESCFDEHGEAFPVFLDFDELARRVTNVQGAYDKRESRLGGVGLEAEGPAAESVAGWLLTSIASGVRPSGPPKGD